MLMFMLSVSSASQRPDWQSVHRHGSRRARFDQLDLLSSSAPELSSEEAPLVRATSTRVATAKAATRVATAKAATGEHAEERQQHDRADEGDDDLGDQ
jgi:hypothetical protein